MYKPLISIIIPVYNGYPFLEFSLESALSQTYTNIEIIIINDGSNDDGKTEEIVKKYNDNRIRYYRKENGGVSSALNFGIEVMNGEWFSWLSHDDIYFKNKIETQLKYISNLKLDVDKSVIISNFELIDSEGKKIPRLSNIKPNALDGPSMFTELCKKNFINGCTVLIPKKAIQSVGQFKNEFKYKQDWFYWLNLAMDNNTFYLLDEILVQSRVHEKQQTKLLADRFFIEEREIAEYFLKELKKSKQKDDYIKNLLFYHYTPTGFSDVRKKYIKYLKINNELSKAEEAKYYYLLGTGQIKFQITKFYRSLMTRLYR